MAEPCISLKIRLIRIITATMCLIYCNNITVCVGKDRLSQDGISGGPTVYVPMRYGKGLVNILFLTEVAVVVGSRHSRALNSLIS